jgi:hypothetical protein
MFPSLSSSVSSSSFVASLSEARLLLRRFFLGSVYCQYSVVKVLSCQCAPEIKTRFLSQQVSISPLCWTMLQSRLRESNSTRYK